MFFSLHCASCAVVELSPATSTHGRPRRAHSLRMPSSSAPMSTPSVTPALASAATQLRAIVATPPVEKVTIRSEPLGSARILSGSATRTRCPLQPPMSQNIETSSSFRLCRHLPSSAPPPPPPLSLRTSCTIASMRASAPRKLAVARVLGPQ